MRNFFYNTYIGVGLVITAIAIVTLLIDTTLCIILFGGGRSILTTLGTEGILPNKVIEVCDYVWGSIILTIYLCSLFPFFTYLLSNINTGVDMALTTKDTTDEQK